ncbi:MAG TPA: tetratricopeptide repeat protein [Gammaproteobacteria bacterium]
MNDTISTIEPSLLAALEQSATDRNAQAQFRLGVMYANGDGMPLNYVKAAQWLTAAAEQGLTEAQRLLAWLYANGYGVEQDYAQARHWFTRAAEGGDAKAQYSLGFMYQTGYYETTPDTREMLKWFQRSADQGNASAQLALGKLLADGKRVAQNDEAAFQWLTLAIMNGNESAKKELAMLTARLAPVQLEQFRNTMMQRMMAGG